MSSSEEQSPRQDKPSADKAEGRETESEEEGDRTSSEVKQESPVLRRSERVNKGMPPQRYVLGTNTAVTTEPQSYQEMMQLPHNQMALWLKAMRED